MLCSLFSLRRRGGDDDVIVLSGEDSSDLSNPGLWGLTIGASGLVVTACREYGLSLTLGGGLRSEPI